MVKFRSGFVSNSSSCSFCIAKIFMTEQQISYIHDLLRTPTDEDDRELQSFKSNTTENEHYFLGHYKDNGDYIMDIVKKISLTNYIYDYD